MARTTAGPGSGRLSGRRRRLPVGPVEVEGIPVRLAPQLRRTRGRRLRDAEERAVGGLKGPGKARSRGSRRRAFWLGEGRLQERLWGDSGDRGAADGVAGLRHVGETFLGVGAAVFSLLWREREWVCSCRALPGSRLFVPRSRRTTDFDKRSLKNIQMSVIHLCVPFIKTQPRYLAHARPVQRGSKRPVV